MKKINIKVVSLVLFVLTLLAGGLTVKQVIAGGNGGIGIDPDPDPV